MKRSTSQLMRRILWFLLLGAIINVAVAWGIGVLSFLWRSHPVTRSEPVAGWPEPVPAHWPSPDSAYQSHIFGWTIRETKASFRTFDDHDHVAESHSYSIEVHAVGWPTGALAAERWSEFAFSAPNTITVITTGHPPPNTWREGVFLGDRYFVALHPIWPGFAINTIFYAAILWLPFAAFGRIRRRRRIKRGLCVRCGYSLRGNSGGGTCPECGAAITMPDSRKPTAESPQ